MAYDYNSIQEIAYSVEDIRQDLGRVVGFFRQQPYHKDAMSALSAERKLPIELLEEQKCFYVPEDMIVSTEIPPWMLNDSLGMIANRKYLIYNGRMVYSVMDPIGEVMGFCGWEKYNKRDDGTTVPKYLDSRNYGYKAKETTLYGMEKLEEYYKSNKPVFVTEGIVCCLYLRSKGYQALALLGSHMTPYVIQILKRFGRRLILVPDCDEAGDSLVKQTKYVLKGCTIVQVMKGKDIDGCRTLDDGIYENQLLVDLNKLQNPFIKLQLFYRR